MKNFDNRANYDKDFYAWTIESAELLRQKKFDEVDIYNIVEEIESLGKNNRRYLFKYFSVLVATLLKWKFQPLRQSKSLALCIESQRFEIEDLLKESPSLKYEVELKFDHIYKKALLIASEHTGFNENYFPKICPFTLNQCLDNNFLPD